MLPIDVTTMIAAATLVFGAGGVAMLARPKRSSSESATSDSVALSEASGASEVEAPTEAGARGDDTAGN